jgi:hypothetical protein
VAGILLDHVHQELAQGDRIAGRVTTDGAQVGFACELFGEGDLLVPCGPPFLHDRLIGFGTVEVAVGFGLWYRLGASWPANRRRNLAEDERVCAERPQSSSQSWDCPFQQEHVLIRSVARTTSPQPQVVP